MLALGGERNGEEVNRLGVKLLGGVKFGMADQRGSKLSGGVGWTGTVGWGRG